MELELHRDTDSTAVGDYFPIPLYKNRGVACLAFQSIWNTMAHWQARSLLRVTVTWPIASERSVHSLLNGNLLVKANLNRCVHLTLL